MLVSSTRERVKSCWSKVPPFPPELSFKSFNLLTGKQAMCRRSRSANWRLTNENAEHHSIRCSHRQGQLLALPSLGLRCASSNYTNKQLCDGPCVLECVCVCYFKVPWEILVLPSETMLETWQQRKRATHGHHVSKLSFGQLLGGYSAYTVIMAWSIL